MHVEKCTLPSLLPPIILSAQVVESDAVARSEDTLEVHSAFFRKSRLDSHDAEERVFEDVPVVSRVAERS